MKKHTFFIAAINFLLILFLPYTGFSQTPEFFDPKNYEGIDFDYSYFIVPHSTMVNSTVDIFTKISFNRLQFIAAGSLYYAEYEITIELRDKNQELKQGKSWREYVTTTDYEKTISNITYHLTRTSLSALPDAYSLYISVEDLHSNNRIKKAVPLKVSRFTGKEFRTTSILFIQNIVYEDDKIKDYVPNIGEFLEKSPNNYAYLEIISSKLQEKYKIETEIRVLYLKKKNLLYKNRSEKTANELSIPIVTDISSLNLPSGYYEITYSISSGFNSKTIRNKFYISWSENPTNEEELNVALDQMKYAFDEVRLQNLKKLTYEEKYQLFYSTWNRRDPSPDTPQNEFKDEYFRRVRYANASFSLFQEGWKTDRGMIYILFGSPSEVIRQESISTPYYPYINDYDLLQYGIYLSYPIQHWLYSFPKNILFSFHDRFGIGDYRLLVPYDYNSWTRPIR